MSLFTEHKGAVMSKTVAQHSCPWTQMSMKTRTLDTAQHALAPGPLAATVPQAHV